MACDVMALVVVVGVAFLLSNDHNGSHRHDQEGIQRDLPRWSVLG